MAAGLQQRNAALQQQNAALQATSAQVLAQVEEVTVAAEAHVQVRSAGCLQSFRSGIYCTYWPEARRMVCIDSSLSHLPVVCRTASALVCSLASGLATA